MKFVRGALGLVLGLALPLAVAGAATIHVPGDYLTIQEAVDAAAYGDEILVAPGSTYASPTREAGAGDTTLCSVILKSGIKLRGSGAGQTFIHGDSVGRVLHLYQCEDVEISDLTVTEGFAEYFGSGIFCRQSSPYIHDVEVEGNWDGGISMIEGSHPVIENCVMDNNEAKAGGGLAVEATCHPYLYDCRITNNRAPFAGGAIVRSDATLYNCTISGNRTSGSVNVLGGGILVVDIAEPVIIGCEISNNECFGNGGGIAFIGEGCGGLLLGCTVTGNVSTGLEGHGGGISVTSGANPEIRKCVVADNYTTGQWSDCGGMYVEYAGVNASDCTFYGNWTEGDGA
ncbi:MAG: right-handed parallel beta-helix repeat-containing protein, partial [Gemmatimonadetes bacterium]|nr:right-handed parallel beta-helix repeat-containing protein [Gemmatimonadota bacterium]